VTESNLSIVGGEKTPDVTDNVPDFNHSHEGGAPIENNSHESTLFACNAKENLPDFNQPVEQPGVVATLSAGKATVEPHGVSEIMKKPGNNGVSYQGLFSNCSFSNCSFSF
jgi:hypothetical protein